MKKDFNILSLHHSTYLILVDKFCSYHLLTFLEDTFLDITFLEVFLAFTFLDAILTLVYKYLLKNENIFIKSISNKMSRVFILNDVSKDIKQAIKKELEIKIVEEGFGPVPKISYLTPYMVDEEKAYLPYAYANAFSEANSEDHGKDGQALFPMPSKKVYSKLKCDFEGELRDTQKVIKTEALENLERSGSTIIAAYPGFGKCLGWNTPVLMYNGDIKMVQDVIVGDKLMGDDSTQRNVLSTCTGQEDMYTIYFPNGDNYTANASHILSLSMTNHKTIVLSIRPNNVRGYIVKRFDPKTKLICKKHFKDYNQAVEYKNSINYDGVLDISIKDYLNLSKQLRNKLRHYKVATEFLDKYDTEKYTNLLIQPYTLGLWLGTGDYREGKFELNLSMRLKKVLGSDVELSTDTEIFLEYELQKVKYIPSNYKKNRREIRLELLAGIIDSAGLMYKNCYEIVFRSKQLATDLQFITRSLAIYSRVMRRYEYDDNNRPISIYHIVFYGRNIQHIPIKQRHLQIKMEKIPFQEYINFYFKVIPCSSKNYYGFTIDGNSRFLLGDFTVTHNTITSIFIATELKLKTLIVSHRIVLINQWLNAIKTFCPNATTQVLEKGIEKEDCDFYIMNAINVPKNSRNYYKDIGFVIVDEVHLIMSEVLSKSMLHLTPRYLLGLSATPYREDKYAILLDLYFGEEKIYRKMHRKHDVYVLNTNFTPTVEMASNGKINWSLLLDSQSNNVPRNEMIIRLVKHFPKRVFLILCKRVEQGKWIVNRLKEEGEDVTSLIGKQQTYEQTSRILVGTTGKCSTGFDHPRLDTLLLATDVQAYFVQVLGRIFRTQTGIPMVIDIIDKNSILKNHFNVRKAVYFEHGGQIKDFKKTFVEFETI